MAGGNDGLATGGVQDADLFAFYDDASGIESLGSQIDQVLHPSKRGDNIFDLSGTLHGSTEKGSVFTLSHARDSGSWGHISIATRQYRCIVDHLHRTAFESAEKSGWAWREIPFDGPILISEMTREFAADIFEFGRCALPSIDESLVSHRFILGELQPHFSKLLGRNVEQCPVT